MELSELIKERRLASAKAAPKVDDEETIFEKVSSKYKEKTPDLTKETSMKKTKLKPDVSDGELDAISARQKAKMSDYPEDMEMEMKPKRFRDIDDRVIKRLKVREEEADILRDKGIPEWKIQERLWMERD